MGGPPDGANLTPRTPGCGRPRAGPRDRNPALSCQHAPVGPGEARRSAALRSDPSARPDLQPGQTGRAILEPTAALGPPRGTCGPSPRSLRFTPPPTILQQLRRQQVLPRARAPPTASGSRAANRLPPPPRAQTRKGTAPSLPPSPRVAEAPPTPLAAQGRPQSACARPAS